MVLVERGAPGVALASERLADGTHLARLGLRAAAGTVLARGAVARRALETAFEQGVVACAAELLGVLEQALDLTVGYLKTREQFGRPIGSFQALQHRAVDMWMQKELTAAALTASLRTFADPTAGPIARAAAASSVKARAGSAAQLICGQAVQLHGALGFTDEYELGGYVNRGVTLAARYGNAAWHRRRFAALTPVAGRA